MTAPCAEFDLAISLRATGALDAPEAARLERHLEGCAACRAEATRADEALGLLRLPPISEPERRVYHGLAETTVERLHRGERRASLGKRVAAALLAAAAAVAVVLAPAVLHRRPGVAPAPAGPAATAAEPAAWEAPDLDDLWEDAAVVELEAFTSAAGADHADAALAALEF
jgi:hypothetical protein